MTFENQVKNLIEKVRKLESRMSNEKHYAEKLRVIHRKKANIIKHLNQLESKDWIKLKKLADRTDHLMHFSKSGRDKEKRRYLIYFSNTEKIKLRYILGRDERRK